MYVYANIYFFTSRCDFFGFDYSLYFVKHQISIRLLIKLSRNHLKSKVQWPFFAHVDNPAVSHLPGGNNSKAAERPCLNDSEIPALSAKHKCPCTLSRGTHTHTAYRSHTKRRARRYKQQFIFKVSASSTRKQRSKS